MVQETLQEKIQEEPNLVIEREKEFNPWSLIKNEMSEDISVFSDSDKLLVEKFLSGEALPPEENKRFHQAISVWWYDKYGSPFNNKENRNKLIERKYSIPEANEQAYVLQEDLLKAMQRENNNDEFEKIKEKYQDIFPSQLEGLMALCDYRSYIDSNNWLNEYRGYHKIKDEEVRRKLGIGLLNNCSRKLSSSELLNNEIVKRTLRQEQLKCLESNTEYMFLMTHFIAYNKDKKFLDSFWWTLEEMAKKVGKLKEMHRMRKGIVTQVAVLKMCEALDKKPKLSTPKQDAFEATDLWVDDSEVAVQVKGGRRGDIPEGLVFEKVDSIVFPSVEVKKGSDEHCHFGSYHLREMQKFRAKVYEYARRRGEKISAYYVAIPYPEIDFVTGEPSSKLLEQAKQQLAKIEEAV